MMVIYHELELRAVQLVHLMFEQRLALPMILLMLLIEPEIVMVNGIILLRLFNNTYY